MSKGLDLTDEELRNLAKNLYNTRFKKGHVLKRDYINSTDNDDKLLKLIVANEPIKIKNLVEITDFCSDKTVFRVVRRLEKKGSINVVKNKHDGREKIIFLKSSKPSEVKGLKWK